MPTMKHQLEIAIGAAALPADDTVIDLNDAVAELAVSKATIRHWLHLGRLVPCSSTRWGAPLFRRLLLRFG